jgi:hypothetical protein
MGRYLAFGWTALAACSSPAPVATGTAPPRQGADVGIAECFLADFGAMAAAGQLNALEPVLQQAIGNGSAQDLFSALALVVRAGEAPDVSQGLSALMTTDGSGALATVLSAGGVAHQLLTDPYLPQAADAAAAVSRTGALRVGVWPASLRLLTSSLTQESSLNAADALQLGGGLAGSYLADALTVQETTPSQATELALLGLADLVVELHQEGQIPPLIDPMLDALADPAMAELLPIAGAALDDLTQNPADLASWDQTLDGFATFPPLLNAQTMQAVQQLDVAAIDGTLLVPDPDGSLRSLNALDGLAGMVGPQGTTLQAALIALRGQATSRIDNLGPLTAPILSYPYRNGQAVTDGSLGDAQKGITQLAQLIYDGIPATSDTSSLANLIGNVPGATALLSSIMGCGTIDPNSPITNLPSYTVSLSYQAFDDIVSQPDELTATARATFLGCFLGRFNLLSGFLQNSLVSGALSLFGVNVNAILNPAVENILQNDLDGIWVLSAGFDPEFNMSLSGTAALGSHTQDGPLRVLYPLLHQLYLTGTPDPVLTNAVRYFVAISGALDGQSYVDSSGQTWMLPPGQMLEGVLPLGQALLNQPTPSTAAGVPLISLLWSLQALPIEAGGQSTSVGETAAALLAEALVRHDDPTVPPLLDPLVNMGVNHVEELASLGNALWPQGGPFALDGASGTPLPLLDRLVSGGPVNLGLAAILGGDNPVPGSVQELQALAGMPLDRMLTALASARQGDPTGQIADLLQRALANGAGGPLANVAAAFLQTPGALTLAKTTITSGLLPSVGDLIEPIDAEGLVPGLAVLGDQIVQANAAVEALAVIQLSLNEVSP